MRPFLCAVLILACTGGSARPPAPVATDYPDLEQAVVRQVNAYRVRRQLRSLKTDTALARIARDHSKAMAERRVAFGHDGFNDRAREA